MFDEPGDLCYSSIMSRRDAVLDASFWINACRGGLAQFLPDYFSLFVCSAVEKEILHPLVAESLSHRRLEWACAAYACGEIDLSAAARYADVSVYEIMDELRRRGIEMVSVEQFLDGLENLADLFELPELREVSIELRGEPEPAAGA